MDAFLQSDKIYRLFYWKFRNLGWYNTDIYITLVASSSRAAWRPLVNLLLIEALGEMYSIPGTPIWKPSTVSRAGVRLGESDVETTGLGDNALRDGSNGDVVGRFRLELNL